MQLFKSFKKVLQNSSGNKSVSINYNINNARITNKETNYKTNMKKTVRKIITSTSKCSRELHYIILMQKVVD